MIRLTKKSKILILVVVGVYVLLPINVNSAENISTIEVTASTIKAIPSCLHYKIIGICFWLVCKGTDCHVETTPKVDHYLPDAVVSVFRRNDSNPWDYANKLVDPVAYQTGKLQVRSTMKFDLGNGNQSESNSTEQNNHFKEVDIIGNPAIVLFTSHSDTFLPSQAKPFMPYYLSLSDAYAWRSPLIEAVRYPAYLTPGVHIVGSLTDNWGAVYPRVGFINQPADGKAAAVIAQRAADIATRGNQPHIYQPLNTDDSCGDHCQTWETVENNSNTKFQMIYPIEQNECVVFGENDLLSPTPWGQDAAVKGDGNYAWIMWRHYKGCIPGNGKYIGSTNF